MINLLQTLQGETQRTTSAKVRRSAGKWTLEMIFSSACSSFSHQRSKTRESRPDHHFNLRGEEEEEEEGKQILFNWVPTNNTPSLPLFHLLSSSLYRSYLLIFFFHFQPLPPDLFHLPPPFPHFPSLTFLAVSHPSSVLTSNLSVTFPLPPFNLFFLVFVFFTGYFPFCLFFVRRFLKREWICVITRSCRSEIQTEFSVTAVTISDFNYTIFNDIISVTISSSSSPVSRMWCQHLKLLQTAVTSEVDIYMTVAHQERVVPQDNNAAKRATNTGCFSQEVRASPGVCADRNIRSSHGKCDHLRRDHKPIKGVFVPKPNQDISDLLQDFFLVNKTGVFHGKTEHLQPRYWWSKPSLSRGSSSISRSFCGDQNIRFSRRKSNYLRRDRETKPVILTRSKQSVNTVLWRERNRNFNLNKRKVLT